MRIAAALLLLLATSAGARPVGWNLEEFTNFNTTHAMCDLMKETGRNWSAGAGASGLVEDDNGWPTSITGGANVWYSVTTRVDQLHADIAESGDVAHYPTGQYTIQCDATVKVGVFRNGPDLTYQCSGTNTHTFTVDATTGEGLEFRVYGGTITNSGDPQLFQVHASGSNPEACDPATDLLTPTFKRSLRGAYGIRFMDWAGPAYRLDTITYLDGLDWADRNPLASRTYASSDTVHRGVPPELPVLVVNEVYEDTGTALVPWIVLPVSVNDDYVSGYAAYTAGAINAAIPFVGVEWCNECWNEGGSYIDQFNHVLGLANDASITGTNAEKVKKYQAQRSAEVFDLWDDEIAVADLRRILGIQQKDCCNPSDANTYLNFDPAGATYGPVNDYVDWVAVAPYGALGSSGNDKHTQNALSSSYDGVTNAQCGTDAAHITSQGTTEFACCPSSCVGIRSWTPAQFCASLRVTIAPMVSQIATHVTAVEAHTNAQGNTLRVVLYEGGMNHDDRVGGSQANLTGEWDETLVAAGHAAHRDACMESILNDYLDGIYAAVHQQPLFLFNLVAKWSKFRQFGFSEYMTDADGSAAVCESASIKAVRYWQAKP